jgi:uncharacterized protein YndB with AHSA1/START domain
MVVTRHQYRTYIKATPDQVWQGITDPALTHLYFHGTAFESTLEVGDPMRYAMEDGRTAVDGVIEVVEAPHRLVTKWRFVDDAVMAEEPPSRVEWTVSRAGVGLTRVDVTHGGLDRSPITWAFVKEGWVWILDGLKTLLETGEPLPDETDRVAMVAVDPAGQWHRSQAIEANNSVWEIIDREDRTAADAEEMLRRAYAAAFHWQRAEGASPANEARALWLLAKVHLLTGQPERSLHYAEQCMAHTQASGLTDFDLAYAHEARARALKAMGREVEAAAEWAAAKGVYVADPEDRAIVDADLADGP